MAQFETLRFPNYRGTTTVEYRIEKTGETLAYVDFYSDGTEAEVTVLNPYRGGERRYSKRDALRAVQIASRHARSY